VLSFGRGGISKKLVRGKRRGEGCCWGAGMRITSEIDLGKPNLLANLKLPLEGRWRELRDRQTRKNDEEPGSLPKQGV